MELLAGDETYATGRNLQLTGPGKKASFLAKGTENGNFGMKLKPLFALSAVASIAIWCNASRSRPLSSAIGRQVRAPGQQQSKPGTKSFSDASEGITFSYPAIYDVDDAAAARLRKQWDLARASVPEKHPTAHLVAYLTDKHNDAHIIIVLHDIPFDLESIRNGAPTGMSDWYWLRLIEFGNNKFYFFMDGGYFYDLNNKMLIFTFDGPYQQDASCAKYCPPLDFRKLSPIEETVLSSLKTPVQQTFPTPPGGFLYTNERYGFQLALNSAWKGYQVSEQRGPSNDITYLIFSVPRSETLNGPVNLIFIGIQSTEVWDKRVSECGCGPNSALGLQLHDFVGATAIGETPSTVFSLESMAHDDDLYIKYQLDRAIESFRPLS